MEEYPQPMLFFMPLIFRETENQPLPTESKAKGLELNRIIESASPLCHPAIITYDVLQEDVLADLQNNEQVGFPFCYPWLSFSSPFSKMFLL